MNIFDLSIEELIAKVNNNEITNKEIYEMYLNRIKENDSKIGAYISYFENPNNCKDLEETKYGLPIAIKDNINVVGTKTTCASKMLENYTSPYDATLVKRLKGNGFSVIGKVNMDEFAFGVSCEYSALKNTYNPHDITKVAGGSSGGSAAAVASLEAVASIGTDTGGSVRQPASYCGVVGFKPSYGTISRYGITTFASSLDQAGIITKNVRDNAYILNIISGYDDKDSTVTIKEKEDFLEGIDSEISGLRVGVISQFLKDKMQEEIHDAIEKTKEFFLSKNCIVEDLDFKYGIESIATYHILSSAEASSNLSRFDGIRYGYMSDNAKDLEDLYKKNRSNGFGEEAKRRIMLGTYVLSAGFYDKYYQKALKVRQKIINYFEEIFKKYDVILMPIVVKSAPKIGSVLNDQEERLWSDLYTCIANIAGLPAISIPSGKDKTNMPISIQLMAKRYDDKKLLNISQNVFKYFNNKG